MKNTTIKTKIFLVLIIIIILFALIILLNSFTTIPTGFVGIRTRFGKASQYIVQPKKQKLTVLQQVKIFKKLLFKLQLTIMLL